MSASEFIKVGKEMDVQEDEEDKRDEHQGNQGRECFGKVGKMSRFLRLPEEEGERREEGDECEVERQEESQGECRNPGGKLILKGTQTRQEVEEECGQEECVVFDIAAEELEETCGEEKGADGNSFCAISSKGSCDGEDQGQVEEA